MIQSTLQSVVGLSPEGFEWLEYVICSAIFMVVFKHVLLLFGTVISVIKGG